MATIERSLEKQRRAITQVRDAYSSAKIFGATSEQLNAAVNKVRNTTLAKVPQSYRAHIDGYAQALSDGLYIDCLVFGCWIDGQFHSTNRNRDDYYEKLGKSPMIYSVQSNNGTRGHYWSHNLKPFFV